MKMQTYTDGTKRGTVKVDFQLTLEDLATAYVSWNAGGDWTEDLKNIKQRAFMDVVKNQLRTEGLAGTNDRIANANLYAELKEAIEILEQKGWF